ncbi:MAG: HAMP domain-containing histidine kinase [Flavobacteriales bacterium]|nr:HAMP domain-containing histidine kinase [Flavobacteriales bacterium]
MDGPLDKAGPGTAERLHRFAHDLRNRLAGLKQVLDHLGDGQASEPELRVFAERQYFKALREVEQLLDDLGVDRGPGQLDLKPLDLSALLRRCVDDLEHRFSRKEQQVRLDIDGYVTVAGDAHHLGTIISALLSNASKFSPRGTSIHVSLSGDAAAATLRVRDEGVGLDADDLRDLFVRYAMLKSRSTDGEPQGRGTLARARQYAQAQHGSLEAHSGGPGTGTEFILRLPSA